MRLIDAEQIKLKGVAVFDENLDILVPLSDVRKAIQMTPTVKPNERQSGHWIRKTDFFTRYICSECGADELCGRKFCPECGADMRGY